MQRSRCTFVEVMFKMNNVRTNSIGLSLLVIMLFSLSGVSLHKMKCNMSGNSFVYVGEMDEPCCEKQPANSLSEKCCDISVAAVQITEFESSQKTAIQIVPVVLRSFGAIQVPQANYARRIIQLANAPPTKIQNTQALLEVFRI